MLYFCLDKHKTVTSRDNHIAEAYTIQGGSCAVQCNREPKMSSETEFSSSQLNASLFEKTFVIITDLY